jgi:hypothetical protein
MRIKVLGAPRCEQGSVVMQVDGVEDVLDLNRWCEPDVFRQVLANLFAWGSQPGALMVTLNVPSADFQQPPAPMLRPEIMDDDDNLLALVVAAEAPLDAPRSDCLDFRPDHQALIQELIERHMFFENEQFVSTLAMEHMTNTCVRDLANSGIVVCRPDEFGDMSVSLRLSSVQLRGTRSLTSPTLVLNQLPREVALSKMCKLEVLQLLYREGWASIVDAPAAYTQLDPLEFDSSYIYGPKSYLVALASTSIIFGKPGSDMNLYHRMKDGYYLALLRMPDLTTLSAKSFLELKAMTDRDFRAALPAILDAGGDGGDDPPAPPAAGGEAVAAVVAVRPVIMDEPGIESIIVGHPGRVNFDKFSHQSGHQRAFLYCRAHVGCRQYTFVKDHPTRQRCVAILLAWNAMRHSADCSTQLTHTAAKPTAANVDLFYKEQFC